MAVQNLGNLGIAYFSALAGSDLSFLVGSAQTVATDPDLPADALSSKQFNTIVELLGEGEIEGSATASKAGITDKSSDAYFNAFKKDIFLNGTQILQEGASNTAPETTEFNYENVAFDFRLGTADQTFIDGINSVETESIIGTTVTTTNPVTHTVSSDEVNAVRVTLRFPSMQSFASNGDINGVTVDLKIKTIENDGTTTTVVGDGSSPAVSGTVTGRSTNAYFKEFLIKLKSTTSFPVAIRVERVTADSTESTLVNAFQFNSATDIIFEQNAYPNTAHIALRLNLMLVLLTELSKLIRNGQQTLHGYFMICSQKLGRGVAFQKVI